MSDLVVFIVIIIVSIWLLRKIYLFMKTNLEKELHELSIVLGATDQKYKGYKIIKTPVYFGFILAVTEYKTNWWIPAENIKMASNKLTFLSLKYGLFTVFLPYVIILIVVNYIVNLLK